MTPELSADGLALIKGKWIEVNKKRLRSLLDRMNGYDRDVTLMDAIKMEATNDELSFSNEDFISSMFEKLANVTSIKNAVIPSSVTATLRPYQVSGYTWLNRQFFYKARGEARGK